MFRFTFAVLLLCVILIEGNSDSLYRRKERPRNLARAVPGQREIVEIGGAKYFFGLNSIVNFFDAQIQCDNINMTLVNLQNEQKHRLFLDYLEENPRYDYWMWTSGQRKAGESSWTWSASNEPFTYAPWAPEEPNVEEAVDACANFAGTSVAPDGWEDDNCELWQMSFLCEEKDE